jgi:hypothetical protein
MTAFSDIAPCILRARSARRCDDRGNNHLQNVDQILQDYTAQYPRKHSS